MKRGVLALIAALGCGDFSDDDVGGGPGSGSFGPLAVRVVRDDVPIAGATVVFQDATGRVIDTERSDDSGIASGMTVSGGMVTAVDPELERRLTTVTQVETGGTIELSLESLGIWGPEVGQVLVNAPTGAVPAGTASYAIHSPCGTELVSSLPAMMKLRPDCGAGFIPIVIIATGPMPSFEDPGPGLAFASAVARADRVATPGPWSVQCNDVAFDASEQMTLTIRPRLEKHAFRWLDLDFCAPYATVDLGEGAIVNAFGYLQGGAPAGSVSVTRSYAGVPASVQITEADLIKGTVALTRFDETGAAWTRDPALASADFVEAKLEWLVDPLEFVVWRFVLPGDAQSAAVPELPEAVVTWDSLETMHTILEIRFGEASWIEDIAGVHAELPLLLDGQKSDRDVPLGGALREYAWTIY